MQRRQFADEILIGLFFSFVAIVAFLSKADESSITLLGYRLPAVCLFKAATGWDCPGCGLSRAVVFALHGQLRESYYMHVLGIPTAILLLLQIPYRFALAFTQQEQFVRSPVFRKWTEIAVSACFLVPWLGKATVLLVNSLGNR